MFLRYLCSFLIILGYDLYQPFRVYFSRCNNFHGHTPCSNRRSDDYDIASTAEARFLRFAIGNIHWMLPSRFFDVFSFM